MYSWPCISLSTIVKVKRPCVAMSAMLAFQAVPYAEEKFVLLVTKGHELAQRGSIDKCELYNLSFVSLNKGSTVQAAQEETLLQQGIKWHKLRTYMVGPATLKTLFTDYVKTSCVITIPCACNLCLCHLFDQYAAVHSLLAMACISNNTQDRQTVLQC